LGAVALSAMSLSMIGTDGAVAKPKSDKIKVNPPTAAEVETGQLLIRDRPVSAAATENDLCGLPYTPPCDKVAPAVDVETGQLLIKDRPVRPSAARKNKTGWIIPTIAVAAALGAVLASGNNDDNPTSP
jgi:hypothetical protein